MPVRHSHRVTRAGLMTGFMTEGRRIKIELCTCNCSAHNSKALLDLDRAAWRWLLSASNSHRALIPCPYPRRGGGVGAHEPQHGSLGGGRVPVVLFVAECHSYSACKYIGGESALSSRSSSIECLACTGSESRRPARARHASFGRTRVLVQRTSGALGSGGPSRAP